MAAENKALQDKMDREAKALQEKMKEENEKRSMESKALADRLEEVSIALSIYIYLFVRPYVYHSSKIQNLCLMKYIY